MCNSKANSQMFGYVTANILITIYFSIYQYVVNLEHPLGYLHYLNPYIFHISLPDLVSMEILFPGLTLALLLGFAKRVGQTANLFLSSALAVIVLKTGGLTPFFLPALGPLVYFYVRQLTWPDRRFRQKDMLHFCSLLVGFWMPGWLVLISVIIYLYLSHRLIEDFYRRLRPVLMDRPRFAFRRLDRALVLLGLCCVLSQFSDTFYLTVAFVLIGMAAEALLKPDSGVQLTMPITDRSDAKEKSRRLKEAVAANRLYEDAELTLTTLAVKLAIHPHDLSRIINLGLEKNFSDFINEFRVREVARKMQDPVYNRLTLLGIAYESGFNSQRTFNRVFKEMTGKTPVEYKNSLKKELPIDKLATFSRIRPVILRSETTPKWSQDKLNRNFMFRNYLKIAWRNIVRHKAYSAINIAGLTVGFAAFLLIFLVVGYQQSFDQFHVHKNQLYRVNRIGREKVNASYRTGVPFPVTASLRNNFPQLANAAAIMPDGNVQVIIRDKGNGAAKKFREDKGIFFVEPQFFDMFSFPLAAGEYRNSLKLSGNVLLTQSWADKYFGHWQTAIGKTFSMDGVPVKVCGILKDMSANTDFPIKAVLSYSTLTKFGVDMNKWGGINDDNYCFIQLKEGASAQQFSGQLDQFTNKYIKPVTQAYFLSIQPLNEIHYDARYGTFNGRVFSKDLILALSSIGIFLLVVACINFINLSTAQAVNRAREVGVRKVMGSSRRQLILQFLGEAALVSCFALLIAPSATLLAVPALNNLLDIQLTAAALFQYHMIFLIVSTLAAVILLAGFYPAFLLSGFNAARVLKSTLSVGQGGISLRRGLVIFQFVTAQVLIMATLVVASQMGYFHTADMGFNKEAVLTAQLPGDSTSFNSQAVLRNELVKMPGIEKVSFGMGAPVDGGWYTALRTPDNTGKEPNMVVAVKMADTGFFSLFHLQFIAGRPYYDSDTSREFVVNESVVRKLGYRDPQQAIGKMINVGGSNRPIAGVVKDFHISSLRDSIAPVVLTTNKKNYGVATIKIKLGQAKPVIASMQKLWDRYYPDFTFSYSFLDQDIAAYYNQENQLSQLYNLFTAVAIFISCLGLYGLVTFMAVQRRKEIGVRKVLGAPVSAILILLSREFTLLIGIAFMIAAPIAWYFMHSWLQQYAYHVTLDPGLFVITIIGSIMIAWVTVGYTALKAAMSNPIKSLRTE